MNSKFFKLFFEIVILVCCFTENLCFGSRRSIQAMNYRQCKQYNNVDIVLQKFKKHTYGKDNSTIEFEANVKKEVPTDFYVVLNFYKCDMEGNPDSCEIYVKDLKIADICGKINSKDQTLSHFVSSFTPALSCPIQPGKYFSLIKVSSDRAFKNYPVPSGVYKLHAEFFSPENSKVIGCVECLFKAIVIKQK